MFFLGSFCDWSRAVNRQPGFRPRELVEQISHDLGVKNMFVFSVFLFFLFFFICWGSFLHFLFVLFCFVFVFHGAKFSTFSKSSASVVMTFHGVMEAEKSIGNGPGSSFLVLSLQWSVSKQIIKFDMFQNPWAKSFEEHSKVLKLQLDRKVDLIHISVQKISNFKTNKAVYSILVRGFKFTV